MKTSVIKFVHYFLMAKSNITLIKDFDYGMSLLLPAAICFLLLKCGLVNSLMVQW